MEGILKRSQRWNLSHTIRYCMVKPSVLRNIVLDRNFSLNGVSRDSAEDFFGFNREDYTFAGEINEKTLPLSYCLMLNNNEDKVVR